MAHQEEYSLYSPRFPTTRRSGETRYDGQTSGRLPIIQRDHKLENNLK